MEQRSEELAEDLEKHDEETDPAFIRHTDVVKNTELGSEENNNSQSKLDENIEARIEIENRFFFVYEGFMYIYICPGGWFIYIL